MQNDARMLRQGLKGFPFNRQIIQSEFLPT